MKVIFLFMTILFFLFSCKSLMQSAEQDLSDDYEQAKVARMIMREINKSCGANNCHQSARGRLPEEFYIDILARPTQPIHKCMLDLNCFATDLDKAKAQQCLTSCIESYDMAGKKNQAGLYNAALKGGIIDRLAKVAEIKIDLLPMPPAGEPPHFVSNEFLFYQFANWLTTQAADRNFRDIRHAYEYGDDDERSGGRRRNPYENADVKLQPVKGNCGEVPADIISEINPAFRMDGLEMFGCTERWPADPNSCLSKFVNVSEHLNAKAEAVHAKGTLRQPIQGLVLKQLRALVGRPKTQYWSRSSSDGRFYATGNALIEDLAMDKNQGRRIKFSGGKIDPIFDPMGRFFGFPTTLCPLSSLYNVNVNEIGREGRNSGKCKNEDLPDYASIGLNTDMSAVVLSGLYGGNSGYDSRDARAADEEDDSGFELVNWDANAIRAQTETKFSINGEGDSMLSPSGKFVITRGSDKTGGQVYNVRRLKDAAGQWLVGSPKDTAKICIRGEKPMMSFDNRFIAVHHHSDGSPQDAGTANGHANIFVYDLKSNYWLRVTNMVEGAKAYFPHFRADGWLYFHVIKKVPGRRSAFDEYLYASNAALLMKNLQPVTAEQP